MINKNILGVIPARRGSKRVLRKNIKPLNGKPLISHTIDTAKASNVFKKIIVTTDDEEVKKIALSNNIEVVDRPIELCKDHILVDQTVLHVMQELEKRNELYDAVCLMTPTAPLRTIEDLKGAINLLWESNSEFVVTATEYDHNPYHALNIINGKLTPEFQKDVFTHDPKTLPKLYRPLAVARMGLWESMKKYKTSFVPDKMTPYIIPWDHAIDIDTEFDFLVATHILKQRNEKESL